MAGMLIAGARGGGQHAGVLEKKLRKGAQENEQMYGGVRNLRNIVS
jgi:hypothetical protein